MADKPMILQVGTLPERAVELLGKRFAVMTVVEGALQAGGTGAGIRGIATTGKAEIGRELLDRLPDLTIVSCLGAGSEGVDAEALDERNVTLATTSHVLAGDVADLAMGLIIAVMRDLGGADRFVRSGEWAKARFPLGRSLGGARLGIVGLGNIGSGLARRASAFDMEVGYHARAPRNGGELPYFRTPAELAGWCDVLALCCPGGAATRNLVDAGVLRALGSRGYLVNVARGSVVDEAALVAALDAGTIAGAGLDVFADEPYPHPALIASPRATLLPHIGSATVETRENMAAAMVQALENALISGT